MKKRILCTLLVSVAISLLLVGCSYSSKTSDNGSDSNLDVNDKIYLSKETEKKPTEENPVATIEMENGGIIKVELYPEIAPNTVRNFITLANNEFYNGLIFHRVISGFMIQGGDPTGNGTGDCGYSIYGEFSKNNFSNDILHERGVISMARGKDKNSAGSQFFIMHSDSPHLDGEYAAFGKVIEGIDEIDKIASSETKNDKPIADIKIKSITVDTFGVNYNTPVKYNK
ncbi:peptidylprolyl isomerase [Clostridium sp.]|uniref:peptidylprolyl isomerase n=1 Tax=Clostridium sp. TaxID=1506 RepID=UPI0032171405